MMQINEKRNNWFERNPKKTLIFFLLFFIVGLTVLAEIIISYKNNTYFSGIIRYIRLREISPLTSRYVSPDRIELNFSDSLIDKKYLLRTDEDGFIVPSKLNDDPEITIVFLGGSTTECRYNDEKKRYPYLTGELLAKETGLKINAYNSGVSGNNTLHLINILLNKIIPLDPNVVVLMENINDLSTLLNLKTYWNNNPSRSLIITSNNFNIKILKRSIKYLFPNLYFTISRFYRFTITVPDEFSSSRDMQVVINKSRLIKEFRSNLQIFIDICKTREITPILMTQPNRLKNSLDPVLRNFFDSSERKGISYQEFKIIYDHFNETIRDIALKNNILCIDLAKEVPQEKDFMFDLVHLTENGSKLVAEIIKRELMPIIVNIRKLKKPSHKVE